MVRRYLKCRRAVGVAGAVLLTASVFQPAGCTVNIDQDMLQSLLGAVTSLSENGGLAIGGRLGGMHPGGDGAGGPASEPHRHGGMGHGGANGGGGGGQGSGDMGGGDDSYSSSPE